MKQNYPLPFIIYSALRDLSSHLIFSFLLIFTLKLIPTSFFNHINDNLPLISFFSLFIFLLTFLVKKHYSYNYTIEDLEYYNIMKDKIQKDIDSLKY